jgi:glutathione S-transferase
LKVNPNGRIPALTDGDNNIFESASVNQWLIEKYDKVSPGMNLYVLRIDSRG